MKCYKQFSFKKNNYTNDYTYVVSLLQYDEIKLELNLKRGVNI